MSSALSDDESELIIIDDHLYELIEYSRDIEVAKVLITHGLRRDKGYADKYLLHAIESVNLNFKIVYYLLENSFNVDKTMALIAASEHGYIEIVRRLIEKGANLNIQNEEGETALIIASGNGYTDIVRLLIEAGATLDIQDKDGDTALMLASSTEIVRLLIEAGINLNIQNNDGHTALITATKRNAIEIARLLIEAGAARTPAALNIQDKEQQTALTIACTKGYETIASLLIKAGANLDLCAEYGFSALHIASKGGNIDIVRLLIEGGAAHTPAINIQTVFGYTALILACKYGHTEIARILIEAGANQHIKNGDGENALHYAKLNCPSILPMLEAL
jgi:ankyrin repeat protein